MELSTRQRALIWLAGALSVLVVGVIFGSRFRINNSLLDILPQLSYPPVVIESLQYFQTSSAETLLLAASGRSRNQAVSEAKSMARELREMNITLVSDEVMDVGFEQRVATIAPWLPYLYSSADSALLSTHPLGLVTRAEQDLLNPLSGVPTTAIGVDPMLTLTRYLLQYGDRGVDWEDGVAIVSHAGETMALLIAQPEPGSSLTAAAELAKWIEKQQRRAAVGGFNILSGGTLAFTAHAAGQAEREISLIGGVSLGVALILMLIVFRSPAPLFLALLTVISGVVAAAVLTAILFNGIHLLTLVFGATLLGIGIDYALHFLCAGREEEHKTSYHAVRAVDQGILLGAASSLLVFLSLAFPALPSLRQIAVFCIVGLGFSALTTLCLLPWLTSGVVERGGQLPGRFKRAMDSLPRLSVTVKRAAFAVVFITMMLAFTRLQPVDDLRQLGFGNSALIESDSQLRSMMQETNDSQFFLVRGKNERATLEAVASLDSTLKLLTNNGALARHLSLTSFLPTIARQQRNAQRFRADLVDTGELERWCSRIGLTECGVAWAQQPLSVGEWSEWIGEPLNMLWQGCQHGGCGAVTRLGGVRDLDRLSAIAAESDQIFFVDPPGMLSRAIGEIRSAALNLLVVATLMVILLLLFRFGPSRTLNVLGVPACAWTGALIFHLVAGGPFTLFHLLAMLVLLGISIDYGLFLQLERRGHHSAKLAVLLSATTTMAAFGSLAFSNTPMLAAFGTMLAPGLLCGVVAAPFFNQPNKEST